MAVEMIHRDQVLLAPQPDPPTPLHVSMPQATPEQRRNPVIYGAGAGSTTTDNQPRRLRRQFPSQSPGRGVMFQSLLLIRPTVAVPLLQHKADSCCTTAAATYGSLHQYQKTTMMTSREKPIKNRKKNKDNPRAAKPSAPASSSSDPSPLPLASEVPSASAPTSLTTRRKHTPRRTESPQRNCDQEQPESSGSQHARHYIDEESDLELDEAFWK